MLGFDIVGGSRRGLAPCARLTYEPENDTWGIIISEDAAPDDLPFMLALFQERGQRQIDDYWTRRWISERIPPAGRQNLGEILRSHKLSDYDEFTLLTRGKGACAQDSFVLRGPFDLRADAPAMPRETLRATVGRKLAAARREAGLTQAQLAERASVDQAVVSRLESGRTNATLDMVEDIADALGADVSFTVKSRPW